MLLYKGGLNASLNVKPSNGFTFANNTTYKLGGKADLSYFPLNICQAEKAFKHCKEAGYKTFIIGNGSNVLASDKGFDGAVISTKKLSGIIRLKNNKLFCLAGTSISRLLNYCKIHGLSGVKSLQPLAEPPI